MKKKILSICLVVALLATGLIGATLAYFTDVDQNTNEFTVGNVTIDLYEKVAHVDGAEVTKPMQFNITPNSFEQLEDGVVLGKNGDTNPNVVYKMVTPGDTMTKVATVENTGSEDAYIALAIKNKGYLNFNNNIDNYYEKMAAADLEKLGLIGDVNTYMQKITDDVFPGWNLLYDKTAVKDGKEQLRYTIDTLPEETEGVEVIGVGYANSTFTANGVRAYNYSGDIFTNISGCTNSDMEGNFDSLEPAGSEEHTRMWVVYLKVAPEAKFTMDLTTVCPTYFDNNSVQAFNGMALDIKAFAIQTDGFVDEKAAFAELFKADDCFAF